MEQIFGEPGQQASTEKCHLVGMLAVGTRASNSSCMKTPGWLWALWCVLVCYWLFIRNRCYGGHLKQHVLELDRTVVLVCETVLQQTRLHCVMPPTVMTMLTLVDIHHSCCVSRCLALTWKVAMTDSTDSVWCRLPST